MVQTGAPPVENFWLSQSINQSINALFSQLEKKELSTTNVKHECKSVQ